MHREAAKGSGTFLYIGTFLFPLILYNKQFSYSGANEDCLKEPFEDSVSFLCLCGLRSWMICHIFLGFAIWD